MKPARPRSSRRRLLGMSAGLALLSFLAFGTSLAATPTAGAEAVVKDLAERAWQLLNRDDLDQRAAGSTS